MVNESDSDPMTEGPATPGGQSGTVPGQKLAVSLPVSETQQPDPALNSGRMGIGSIAIAAIAAAVILGVVLYGLNSTPPAPQASAPAQTASSAPTAGSNAVKPAPQAGKNGHS